MNMPSKVMMRMSPAEVALKAPYAVTRSMVDRDPSDVWEAQIEITGAEVETQYVAIYAMAGSDYSHTLPVWVTASSYGEAERMFALWRVRRNEVADKMLSRVPTRIERDEPTDCQCASCAWVDSRK